MAKVKVIEAKQSAAKSGTAKKEIEKIRVGAYARVSTDHSDQETSYEAQQTHFKTLIEGNPAWELVDIYADEESGTQADKRENFMRMIADCEAGKIQMVLTKSISRFARNTLDALNYIRKLKALNIPILFTKEGINTLDAGGEVLVTILASIAQQESASISQNVQLGVRYHYQEGKVCSGTHNLLGYKRTPEGGLELVPGEACIVRRIFREYLDGYNIGHIAKRLETEGVNGNKVTVTGREVKRKWNFEGLEYLIQNEKYSGDLLLQKYYTVDFLTKKVAINEGQVPQYLAENNHDPIIPKAIFLQTQAEMARRRANPRAFVYLHDYPFSSKIVCGCCGNKYRRTCDKRYNHVNWRCESKVAKGRHPGVDCKSRGIREEIIEAAVVDALNRLPEVEEELEGRKAKLIEEGIQEADSLLIKIKGNIGILEAKESLTKEQQKELEALHVDLEEVSAQRTIYADEELQIRNLMDRMHAIKGRDTGERDSEIYGACNTPEEFWSITRAKYESGPVQAFSCEDVFRLVERICVEEDQLTVTFRAGVSITVDKRQTGKNRGGKSS